MTVSRAQVSALLIVDMVVDFFDSAIWPESDLPALRPQLVSGLQPALKAFARQAHR